MYESHLNLANFKKQFFFYTVHTIDKHYYNTSNR